MTDAHEHDAHAVDEDAEEHIGEPVPDPWDEEREVGTDG